MTESEEIMKVARLAGYAFLILLAGFILWRISVRFQQKKSKPQRGKLFKSKYKDHWNK